MASSPCDRSCDETCDLGCAAVCDPGCEEICDSGCSATCDPGCWANSGRPAPTASENIPTSTIARMRALFCVYMPIAPIHHAPHCFHRRNSYKPFRPDFRKKQNLLLFLPCTVCFYQRSFPSYPCSGRRNGLGTPGGRDGNRMRRMGREFGRRKKDLSSCVVASPTAAYYNREDHRPGLRLTSKLACRRAASTCLPQRLVAST